MLSTNTFKSASYSGGYSEPDTYWQKPIKEGRIRHESELPQKN